MQAVSITTTLKKQPMVLGKSMPSVFKGLFFADEHIQISKFLSTALVATIVILLRAALDFAWYKRIPYICKILYHL